MSARPASQLPLLLVALLPAACLEVESTEIQVVADRAADRLDVMILSRGVSSSGTNDQTIANDLADLCRCRDAAAIPVPGIGIVDFAAQPSDDEDPKNVRSLLPFVDIEAGAFFVDEQGKLGFYQFARIHRLKEFCALVDARVYAAWRADKDKIPAATRELQERAEAAKLPLLRIEGAGFVFARPLAEEDHRRERLEFWRDVVKVARADAEGEAGAREGPPLRGEIQVLAENDVAIVRRENVTEYVVGTLGGAACSYRLPGKEYKDNLLKQLEQSEPRPPAVTQALVEKQFAAFHSRAARLPAEYQALEERARADGARK